MAQYSWNDGVKAGKRRHLFVEPENAGVIDWRTGDCYTTFSYYLFMPPLYPSRVSGQPGSHVDKDELCKRARDLGCYVECGFEFEIEQAAAYRASRQAVKEAWKNRFQHGLQHVK